MQKEHVRYVLTLFVLISTSAASVALGQSGTGLKQPILAATPAMGWNSWNHYKCAVSDGVVRAQADAMVTTGMKAVGYEYVNIDDCWQGQRDAKGYIHPNHKFPDMKALADYVHSKGLKLGIYSSPGPKSCDQYEGSYGHEQQDAEMFAAWNIDYLKYDWCSARDVYQPPDYPRAFQKMHAAILRSGRPMVYSIHGRGAVWEWAASAGANLWRTTGDIEDNYARMVAIGFGQNGLEAFAGPSHWNDPDMLEIGNGGMRDNEYRMHMSLWALLAAPLIAGNDLTTMKPNTLAIFTNSEVIAVDQDPDGVQGHRVFEQGPVEIWMRFLANGSKAVGLFNREQGTIKITVNFKNIGVRDTAAVRDLWKRKDVGIFHGSFSADVAEHDAVLVNIR